MDLDLFERVGVALNDGGYLGRDFEVLSSTSMVDNELLDEDCSLLRFRPKFAPLVSDPELAGRGCGRRIFPAVPSEPSVSARSSALARVSCSCFVASFGSAALLRN